MNALQIRLTTAEGAALVVHTKPILEGPSLGHSTQVLQLRALTRWCMRCDMQIGSLVLFLNACGHMKREPSPPDLFHTDFRYKTAELR